MWHPDAEDFRILNVVVFLNDVDTDRNPFTFILRHHTPNFKDVTFSDDRVLDEDIEKLISKDQWVECCGPKGTMLIADPGFVCHRGKPGTRTDRYSLFFAWNPKKPLNPQYCLPMFDKQTFSATQSLSAKQQKVIQYDFTKTSNANNRFISAGRRLVDQVWRLLLFGRHNVFRYPVSGGC